LRENLIRSILTRTIGGNSKPKHPNNVYIIHHLFNANIEQGMTFPEHLRYSKDHEWVRVEGTIGIVGITDHAQHELGDIVYVDIPDTSATVKAGDTFGTIEAVKTVADLFAPVSGKIVEVHAALNDAPDVVNNDPYNEGWIVKIELADSAELETLMDATAYKALIGQ